MNAPTAARPIRVLVAEDSATIRYHLVRMIEESDQLIVIGQARDGEEALAMTQELKPDVISMDIRMPRMDGFEATRSIMTQQPTPVVIVSGLVEDDVQMSFQALEAGALAVVEKPPDRQHPHFAEKQRRLLRTLEAMSQVGVVRRQKTLAAMGRKLDLPAYQPLPEIIAIGASAGGPSALSHILSDLPEDLPVPIIVAQHIPDEFVNGLARWLSRATTLQVVRASHNAVLKPGVVHLSPGAAHLQVARRGDSLVTHIIEEQGTHRYQPSVDVLFDSVAMVCGAHALGIILTGMGDDGAEGLLAMRQAGARTIAQDEASATVYGMPGAAIVRGAVQQVVALTEIPSVIIKSL
ncbi:MAG: chemotaxis response regulator protein-glutamate methylesterase [Anaerolineae bacterium]